MNPLVIGHRGAAAYALENTSLSFRKAVQMGVDWIELDVRETLDGEFMVVHDSHLGRISSRRVSVHKSYSIDLRAVVLNDNQRLLTLAEAFETIPSDRGLMIEVKALRSYEKMAALIAPLIKLRQVMLTSFDLKLLLRLQICKSRSPLGVVSKTLSNLSKAKEMGLDFENACLDFHSLSYSSVARLRKERYKIFGWTVDRTPDIEKMLDLEIDGIISNKPDLVRRLIETRMHRVAE